MLCTLNVLAWSYKLISHKARSDSDALSARAGLTFGVSEATVTPYHKTSLCVDGRMDHHCVSSFRALSYPALAMVILLLFMNELTYIPFPQELHEMR